jgi:hypothetical protein
MGFKKTVDTTTSPLSRVVSTTTTPASVEPHSLDDRPWKAFSGVQRESHTVFNQPKRIVDCTVQTKPVITAAAMTATVASVARICDDRNDTWEALCNGMVSGDGRPAFGLVISCISMNGIGLRLGNRDWH